MLLLQEVSAMAASGRSLVTGLTGLNDAALGRLGRAAKQVRDRIQSGQSAAVAMGSLSAPFQSPIRVAMQLMAQTGSTEPIRETVRLIRQKEDARRRLRLASIGPILNVVVGACVLFLVMPWIYVQMAASELIRGPFAPTVTEICQTFAQNFTFACLVALVVAVLFALWLRWSMHRSFEKNKPLRSISTFCRWLAMQIQLSLPGDIHSSTNDPNAASTVRETNAIDVSQAVEFAGEVATFELAEGWRRVAAQIRGGGQSVDALQMPTETPDAVQQCVVDLVAGKRDARMVANDLNHLASLYHQQSQRKLRLWAERVPQWMSGLILIAIICLLLQTAITPLVDAVGEIAQ
ncbi:type II secretion system F family protein [Rhodopirellula sp. JC740]|uniref:Type II secretion system F family protein n=1 Tax=Rhodopirellula halodulae TaxID=2894198 RepID=A0ABS8NC64_9BACT|nr:type II secretion system F family protein [Rhodopirellula sp. JC740]